MTRVAFAGPLDAPEHALAGHPERPARVLAAAQGVDDLHLGTDLVAVEPRDATIDELASVHPRAYLAALQTLCEEGGGRIDADTYARAGSWSAATRAAGAGLEVIAAMRAGAADLGFVAARPPGHHAGPSGAMGFCLVNNIAVAARELTAQGDRVAIVDWDVHHGNGTQDAFWDDPQVLYVSTHQYPWYPGTGRADETGGAGAPGLTVNIPLPAGATGDVVLRALEDVAGPAVAAFAPTWMLVSAGFDAHRDDPLADLQLTDGDFANLAKTVAGWGRLVLFLEGGYDLDAMRSSTRATLAALVDAPTDTEPATIGGPGLDAVARAAAVRR